jgi:glycerophosphoryl diester phosphodiesterase
VPENSLAAFDAAIAIGAGIECDVRLSGDQAAVVFHDGNLDRMCGVALGVERTSSALLIGQRLAGADQYIPALWQVLEHVGGRVPLLLELKTRDLNAATLCREVVLDLSPAAGAIGVMSFDPRVGLWLRRHATHIRRGLILRARTPAIRRRLAIALADPQFLALELPALGQSWVRRMRESRPIYAWTVRTPAERAQLQVQADALIWEGDGRP